jgi:hypothetical protein
LGLNSNSRWCSLIFLILFYGTSNSYAQNFQISPVLPFLSHDSVMVEIGFQNFFGKSIRKPLLAGLPILLHAEIMATSSGGEMVQQREMDIQLSYNVWEEIFHLSFNNRTSVSLETLDQLQNWLAKLPGIFLLPTNKLLDSETYQIKVVSQATILTRQQSSQLQKWMQESDQTEEDSPSQGRSTGFRLNLNQLIQMFFSRDKSQEAYQATGESMKFTLGELRQP